MSECQADGQAGLVHGDGEPPVKTAKQLEKEAKKLAKLEKFNQKKDKKIEAPLQTKEKVEVGSVKS